MTQYKKISELDLITTVQDTDLFIVETASGTKAVKIAAFKKNDITKADVGLGNVDNTADLDKPISAATQGALDLKADTATMESSLALKADTTDVDSKLKLKADLSDMTTKLGLKADTETVNASLALKADIETVNASLALKADDATVKATYTTKEEFNKALSDIETLLQGV